MDGNDGLVGYKSRCGCRCCFVGCTYLDEDTPSSTLKPICRDGLVVRLSVVVFVHGYRGDDDRGLIDMGWPDAGEAFKYVNSSL